MASGESIQQELFPAEPGRHPMVVHCKRSPFDVYIGRPSPWGNPFEIGKDGTRAEVIAKYRDWIATQPSLLARLPELRGKTLGCWCSPRACHGRVLQELANLDILPALKGRDSPLRAFGARQEFGPRVRVN